MEMVATSLPWWRHFCKHYHDDGISATLFCFVNGETIKNEGDGVKNYTGLGGGCCLWQW